jgi:hypothetical protein
VDAGPYKACSSSYTLPLLPDGLHAIFVKAIDAPGNESGHDLLGPETGRDLIRRHPLIRICLQRLQRRAELPARWRRLWRLQLAGQLRGRRGRPSYVPGQGDGSGPEHRCCLTHLDRRRHGSPGDLRQWTRRRLRLI